MTFFSLLMKRKEREARKWKLCFGVAVFFFFFYVDWGKKEGRLGKRTINLSNRVHHARAKRFSLFGWRISKHAHKNFGLPWLQLFEQRDHMKDIMYHVTPHRWVPFTSYPGRRHCPLRGPSQSGKQHDKTWKIRQPPRSQKVKKKKNWSRSSGQQRSCSMIMHVIWTDKGKLHTKKAHWRDEDKNTVMIIHLAAGSWFDSRVARLFPCAWLILQLGRPQLHAGTASNTLAAADRRRLHSSIGCLLVCLELQRQRFVDRDARTHAHRYHRDTADACNFRSAVIDDDVDVVLPALGFASHSAGVFNDFLRLFDECGASGEKCSTIRRTG